MGSKISTVMCCELCSKTYVHTVTTEKQSISIYTKRYDVCRVCYDTFLNTSDFNIQYMDIGSTFQYSKIPNIEKFCKYVVGNVLEHFDYDKAIDSRNYTCKRIYHAYQTIQIKIRKASIFNDGLTPEHMNEVINVVHTIATNKTCSILNSCLQKDGNIAFKAYVRSEVMKRFIKRRGWGLK